MRFTRWLRASTLAAVLALVSGPAAGAADASASAKSSKDERRISHHVLENGLRVSIHSDARMPVVATQVWYHVGSANERGKSRGFAHLFEHLMFGGTATYGKEDYARHHQQHGGFENAYTTQDQTVYVSSIAPDFHDKVLEMEADRMVNLRLDAKNLANEKKIVTEELRLTQENNPESRVVAAALKAVLGKHPYANLPTGTKKDIAAATLDEAKAFYRAYYRPKNAHIVIVGPVDPAAVLARVKLHFGKIPPGGTTPPDVPSLTDWEWPEKVEVTEDLPPVETALLAYPLPPADHPDYETLLVLAQLLGGGNVDPFEEELVKKRGKAVYAASEFIFQRRGGALIFAAAYLPYRRKSTGFKLIEETQAKVSGLEWLTDASLASAKRTMLRRDLAAAYYSDRMAQAIGESEWWLGDGEHAFDLYERIEKVKKDDVAAAYRKYVLGQKPVRVYIRPEKIPLFVRMFGWLYPLLN